MIPFTNHYLEYQSSDKKCPSPVTMQEVHQRTVDILKSFESFQNFDINRNDEDDMFLLPQDLVYRDIVSDILETGELQENRTGINTLYKIGKYWELDTSPEMFPILTTKRVFWKSAFSEMLGFLRGYSSAADFRNLGCNVWDANANENQEWLNNPNRKGTDDLGRVYGVQWRDWKRGKMFAYVDQINNVITDLSKGIDNRREIVTAWNPGELDQMALPPCHMTMIFSLVEDKTKVDLFLLLRSSDTGLGLPYNMIQYAFLLNLIAMITKKNPGTLRIYANNIHIYENHLDALKEQLTRNSSLDESDAYPVLILNDDIDIGVISPSSDMTLSDIASVEFYNPHPPIKMEMAV